MQGLVNMLPKLRDCSGRTVVIKYGGNAMIHAELKQNVVEDISLLHTVGARPVVVHGGGPEITAVLKQLGMQSKFVSGLRVTDQETAAVAEMVLVGKINPELVRLLNQSGVKAVGLNGKDTGLVSAKKHLAVVYENHAEKQVDIGYVGDIERIDTHILNVLFAERIVPVIAPTGADAAGNTYNINADYVAGEIAASLKADILLLLTDTEGVYRDYTDKATFLSKITARQAQEYIKDGSIEGGMIPKVECCLTALQKGAKKAVIVDGRVPHAILKILFTNEATGTEITSV